MGGLCDSDDLGKMCEKLEKVKESVQDIHVIQYHVVYGQKVKMEDFV